MSKVNRRMFLLGTAAAAAAAGTSATAGTRADKACAKREGAFCPGSIDDPNPGFPNGDARRPSTYKVRMKMDGPGDLRVMFVVAHPDDAEILCGGTIAKLAKAGATVNIVSVTDGRRGHQWRNMREMVKVRYDEAQDAGKALGVDEYIVGPVPDCELVPTPENRAWLTDRVRRFAPHIIVTHRTCDYHTDHRACGQLVQDMVYLLGVPLWCTRTPVPAVLPTVFYMADWFTVPRPFRADLFCDCTDTHELFIDGLMAHPSQMFEWLCPQGDWHDQVPPESDVAGRRALIARHFDNPGGIARQYRGEIAKAYGKVLPYAEAFEIGEYGRRPSERERNVLESIGFRFAVKGKK